MNLEKIEELWAKDAEAFYDHRELPELLANDSMETPRLHTKNTCNYIMNLNLCSQMQGSGKSNYIKRSGYIITVEHCHSIYRETTF